MTVLDFVWAGTGDSQDQVNSFPPAPCTRCLLYQKAFAPLLQLDMQGATCRLRQRSCSVAGQLLQTNRKRFLDYML